MKFVADAMLGRLAKWLRIIGCDVAYFADIPDKELIELALRENRILLTRDTLLIKRKAVRNICFFVESDHFRDQLNQVVKHFSLSTEEHLLSRCIECNLPLKTIEKDSVKERVPPFVFQTNDSFSQCPGCNKVYWPATHGKRIKKELL